MDLQRGQKTDKELVTEIRSGNESSLSMLIERHMSGVYRFVWRYCRDNDIAEGLTQDVFVKVWKNIGRFKIDKNFSTWLYAIAKNTSLDWLKQKRPEVFSHFETDEGNMLTETLRDTSKLPNETAEERETHQSLETMLASLGKDAGKVVRMRDFEDFSFKDIAEVLKKPVNTVKSTYRRAILLLRKSNGGNGHGNGV